MLNRSLVCNETRSVDTACQVSSRLPTVAFYYTQRSVREFPRKCLNAALVNKDYAHVHYAYGSNLRTDRYSGLKVTRVKKRKSVERKLKFVLFWLSCG